MIEDLIGSGRSWKNLSVFITMKNRTVVFSGSGTRPYNGEIKGLGAFWDGSAWTISPKHLQPDQLKRLFGMLDKDDAQKASAPAAQKSPDAEKAVNRKGDRCRTCGGWVEPGEGWLFSEFDDDDEKMVYYVRHKDADVCKANLEAAKIRAEQARSKQNALSNLRMLAVQPLNYIEGSHTLKGKQIWIDDQNVAYGGGEWVVIEPDEKHFWFVQNNGADGDDWSRNNVMTGGAGAIGYRAALTPQARILIETAAKSKVDLTPSY